MAGRMTRRDMDIFVGEAAVGFGRGVGVGVVVKMVGVLVSVGTEVGGGGEVRVKEGVVLFRLENL